MSAFAPPSSGERHHSTAGLSASLPNAIGRDHAAVAAEQAATALAQRLSLIKTASASLRKHHFGVNLAASMSTR
jgi:hypothetical protein